MKYLSLTALVLSVAFGVANVSAQEADPIDFEKIQQKFDEMTDKEFQKIDTNADGEVSLSEYQDYIVKQTLEGSEKSFAQFDKDGDGIISKDEYTGFMSGFTAKIQEAIKKQQQKTAQ